MKLFLTVFLIILFSFTAFAAVRPGFGLDLGSAQDLLSKDKSYCISADLRCSLTESFEVRTPLTLSVAGDYRLFDTGLFLTYYPFPGHGLFMSLSLFQFGFIKPADIMSRDLTGLNEVQLGWTFDFRNGLFIEPAVSIRDPSGTFSDEYSAIQGVFPGYKTFRIHINMGWKFIINKEKT